LFGGGFVQDRFALFAKAAVLLALAAGVAAADWELERLPGPLPAALIGGFGVMVAASATDLFAVWTGAAVALLAAASALAWRPGVAPGTALAGPVRALAVAGAALVLRAGLGAALAPGARRTAGLLAASQLGWVAAAVATHERGGLGAGLFLLGAAVLGAVVLPTLLGDLELEAALAGLGGRSPARAAALTVAAVSLAGAPPLAGFFGVFLVAASLAGAGLYWVITLALLGSILAAVGAVRIGYAACLLEEEDTRAPAR